MPTGFSVRVSRREVNRVPLTRPVQHSKGWTSQKCGTSQGREMTGKNPLDANRSSPSLPQEFFDGGIEYEIVEGELLPRGPHSRAWDAATELS